MPMIVLHLRRRRTSIGHEADGTVTVNREDNLESLKEAIIKTLHLDPDGTLMLSSKADMAPVLIQDTATMAEMGLVNGDTLFYHFRPAYRRSASTTEPAKPILKRSGSQKEADAKRVLWDEDNIDLYEIEKKLYPRQTIDEPDTPFHVNVELGKETYSDLSGGAALPQPNAEMLKEVHKQAMLGKLPSMEAIEDGVSVSSGSQVSPQASPHIAALTSLVDTAEVAEALMAPDAVRVPEGSILGRITSLSDDGEEGEKAQDIEKKFVEHRKKHYNEAEMLHKWREEHKHDMDEEEEDVEAEVECAFDPVAHKPKRDLSAINQEWGTS